MDSYGEKKVHQKESIALSESILLFRGKNWCESFQIFYYAFKCIILFCVFTLNDDILFCYWILKIVYLKHKYVIQNSTLKW